MPEKNFFKEVICPLLMRFVAAVMVTIAVSLGLALVVHALEEESVAGNPTTEIKTNSIKQTEAATEIKVSTPKPETPPVQVVHYQD